MWKGLDVLYLIDFRVRVGVKEGAIFTIRPLLEVFILVLGPNGVLRLIVWKIILPFWATHQRETSTLRSLPLVATWGRHGTADYYRPLHATHCTALVPCKWGERWLLCQTINWNFECSLSCARVLKSLRSHHRLLLNFSTEAADTQTVERHLFKLNF